MVTTEMTPGTETPNPEENDGENQPAENNGAEDGAEDGAEGNATPMGQSENPETATFALQEKLDGMRESFNAIESEYNSKQTPTDDETKKFTRTANLWRGRISKMEEEIGQRRQSEAANPTAASAGTGSQPAGRKPKVGGTPNCLCGCGHENKSGSRFQPGHDARVKGQITRVNENKAEVGFQFPAVLIEQMTANSELKVAQYDAAFILSMNEKLGRGEGYKAPKAEVAPTNGQVAAATNEQLAAVAGAEDGEPVVASV